MLKKLKYIFIETVFPAHCVICEKIGSFICDDCYPSILRIEKQGCVFCNKITKNGRLCHACRPKHALTGVVTFGYFKDKKLKEIIHKYKYEDLFALSEQLAIYLEDTIKKEGVVIDLITFVPIGKKRMTKRGYNQSELLAIELGKRTEAGAQATLKKTKETKTQVGLKRRERTKNLKNVFEVMPGPSIINKRVLLLDDVVTTGATLDECAKVLRRAGAREVWGLTVAKE